MDLTILLASILAGAAALLVSYGAWSVATAERQRVSWRVSRTGIGVRPGPERTTDVRIPDRAHAVFSPVDRAITRYGWAERGAQQLQKASINLHVSEFIAARIVSTVTILAVSLVVALKEENLLVGLGGAAAAAFVWWQFGSFVRRRIKQRQDAIEAQLDDALTNLSGSLRAGFSFTQACQMAIPQLRWPLKEELQTMIEEINVGLSLDDALRNLAERVDSYEMDITVNAVLVQRQVGGSLAEILDSLAGTIRERRELRGHLMALTAQQRLSAIFVAAVPVFMLGLLSLTSWQFMKPLFVTQVGNILIVFGLLMDMLGFLLMRKLTRIDY
jgi:tight adherence protein B